LFFIVYNNNIPVSSPSTHAATFANMSLAAMVTSLPLVVAVVVGLSSTDIERNENSIFSTLSMAFSVNLSVVLILMIL
jgi:hypothetical protein